GTVQGIALDSTTREPLAFATVMLKTADGQVVKGGQTVANGSFALTAIPFGRYLFSVSFVGYVSLTRQVVLSEKNPVVDMGDVLVKSSSETIGEVTVVAEKNSFVIEPDKEVFEADKIDGAIGGSVADLLRQIPSLEVDADDNLQMRGKAAIITIDGRPSPFPDVQTTMQMLPADVIERIEVITNPSARYQSDSEGGIVNIVLKKDKVQGYNGAISAGLEPGTQYMGGGNINYRKGRLNLFATANVRYNDRVSSSRSERSNLRSDTVYAYMQQANSSASTNLTSGYKFGLDYFFDNKNSATIYENISLSDPYSSELVAMDYYNVPATLYRRGERRNVNDNGNSSYVTEAHYKHQFNEKKEHEFSAVARYVADHYERNSSYVTEMDSSLTQEDDRWQQKRGGVTRNRMLLKADYVMPLSETGKFEAGISANNQWNQTLYDAQKLDSGSLANPVMAFDNTQAENYRFTEQIYSAYIDYANALESFSYKLGVRAEASSIDGQSVLKDSSTAFVDRTYFYLFPSARATYYFSRDVRLTATYSSRIARPSFLQLVPFSDVSDMQNIRLGSPDLLPSRTHNAELKFYRYYEQSQNMLNIDIYYSHTRDEAQRVSFIDDLRNYVPDMEPDSVSVSRVENVGLRDVVGATCSFRYKQVENLTLSATLNGSYNAMSGLRNGEPYSTYLFSGTASMAATYIFPHEVVVNLSGRYRLPTITAQGSSQNLGTIDLSIRHAFFDKALTASVVVYDLLNTARSISHSTGTGFRSSYERQWDSRQVRFSLMYKFGRMNVDINPNAKQSVERSVEAPPKRRGL
ncbi:MAG: TonB-dependent receptor, partial [Prevotellaceae bacterium]|nr:TonB-dependent receptor [Prevotellaceae bacterium]